MACLDTYKNPDQKGHYPPMSPRLSFSNDFVESHHAMKLEEKSAPKDQSSPNISSDFEFSVTNHTMTAADELFFKGKLLPTLRDELLVEDDDDGALSFVPPKGLPKWKEFLSLKRSADGVGSSKTSDGRCTANAQGKMLKLAVDEEAHVAMSS